MLRYTWTYLFGMLISGNYYGTRGCQNVKVLVQVYIHELNFNITNNSHVAQPVQWS
jgi:hypothetical protein